MRFRPPLALIAVLLYALLAALQLTVFVQGNTGTPGWFLFGTDTVSHDMPVALWIRSQYEIDPSVVPLWMSPLQGGLPTLGAFLWTPFAPQMLLHNIPKALSNGPDFIALLQTYPAVQVAVWGVTLWWAGLGGFAAARALRLGGVAALAAGAAWMLSGHLVTLIHAGHLQKVMALAWFGWAFAGVWMAVRPRTPRVIGGTALAGLAIGMMLLSGHPQIVYIALLLAAGCVLLSAIVTRQLNRIAITVGVLFAVVALGGLTGGLQVVPGIEMSAASIRADGVGYEEAVKTSYPPKEVLEFISPRFLGSSTSSDTRYLGTWGNPERIVSDYAGIVFVALALMGCALGWRRREVRGLVVVLLLALVIGFGKYTPLYKLLYAVLPGFSSFRSPATIYCMVAFALAMLSGFGVREIMNPRGRKEYIQEVAIAVGLMALAGLAIWFRSRLWPAGLPDGGRPPLLYRAGLGMVGFILLRSAFDYFKRPIMRTGVALLLLAGASYDVMSANKAFLITHPFAAYQASFGQEAADAYLLVLPKPRRASFPGRELSLRGILKDVDVLNGYHPISYALKEESDRALTLHSPEWRKQWGIGLEIRPGDPSRPAGAGLSMEGGLEAHKYRENSPVRVLNAAGEPLEIRYMWANRHANRVTLRVDTPEAGKLEVAEMSAPGWKRIQGTDVETAHEVALVRTAQVPAGPSEIEWRYEPESYRNGMWMSAAGLGIVMFGLFAGFRRRWVKVVFEPSPARIPKTTSAPAA